MLHCMAPQWELLTVGWDTSKCRVKSSLCQGKKLLIRNSSLRNSWFICMCNIHLHQTIKYMKQAKSEHLSICLLCCFMPPKT